MSYIKIIKGLFERVKGYFNSGEKKKRIENFVIAIIIGVIIIIAGGSFFSRGGSGTEDTDGTEAGAEEAAKPVELDEGIGTSNEMKSILSQIEGAGHVDVMITYSSDKEMVPAYDTRSSGSDTEEKDSDGGTRSVTQKEEESSVVFQQDQAGARNPVILKKIEPEVKGVVVVADGAGEPVVRERLISAVRVLMDIPPHRVQVFERKK